MSQVKVNVAAYSTTHVATGMLRGLKVIIKESGLSPARLAEQWTILESGVATWLASGHLRALVLEIWDPDTPSSLVGRFDFTIDYDYYSAGDGDLWLDPDTVRQAIGKAGTYPSLCEYRFIADTGPGFPAVDGWSSTALRSTAGMRRFSVGTAVGGGALGASLSYYRRI